MIKLKKYIKESKYLAICILLLITSFVFTIILFAATNKIEYLCFVIVYLIAPLICLLILKRKRKTSKPIERIEIFYAKLLAIKERMQEDTLRITAEERIFQKRQKILAQDYEKFVEYNKNIDIMINEYINKELNSLIEEYNLLFITNQKYDYMDDDKYNFYDIGPALKKLGYENYYDILNEWKIDNSKIRDFITSFLNKK